MAAQEKPVNNEEMLQLAINAAKKGQREGARVMFRELHQRDRRNETAMLWLAKLAQDDQERIQWLERVLEVNPANPTALKALEKMQYMRSAVENRMLFLFGGVAVVMIVLTLTIFLLVVLN